MKIALVGTGQMGQAVAALAPRRGHDIVKRFDSSDPLTEAGPAALSVADVVIDFSLPDVALDHLKIYCDSGCNAVVGTTGWYGALDRVAEWVDASEAGILYAPNFSIGVAVMQRALEAVGPLINRLPEYDAYVHEMHHTRKVDSPSGTAHMLGEVLVEALDRKSYVETETQHDRIDPEALHVTSTRAGGIFGEHTAGFDSDYDRITVEHRAKSREGFAFGAVQSAEWLQGRQGLFTLEDVLDAWNA